jgi:hypothetical protein
MYRLGLRHSCVDEWRAAIGQLLGRRNAVAHAAQRLDLDGRDYSDLVQAVIVVVESVMRELFDAAVRRAYLKPVPAGA